MEYSQLPHSYNIFAKRAIWLFRLQFNFQNIYPLVYFNTLQYLLFIREIYTFIF